MLTSITIDAIDDIPIPIIGATIAEKYIIQSISGLGPPDISVVIGDLATDGGVYQNRRVPSRNTVILMGFNPDYSVNETIDDLRDALYLAFLQPNRIPGSQPKARVILHDSAKPDRYVEGVVEKLEIAHFTKDPAVQISILSTTNPFLIGDVTYVVPTGDEVILTNPGTAESGFKMVVEFTADVTGFTLTRDSITPMTLDYPFLNGDTLEINTIPAQRRVRRKRSDEWLNIIDSKDDLGFWPTLYPGENTIEVSTDQISWTSFEYTPQWWGV